MVKAEDILNKEDELYNKLKDVENPKTIFKKETVKVTKESK